MKIHSYNGKRIIEYSPTDFVGFYYNSDYKILQTRSKSLKEIKENLDKYDQRSSVS